MCFYTDIANNTHCSSQCYVGGNSCKCKYFLINEFSALLFAAFRNLRIVCHALNMKWVPCIIFQNVTLDFNALNWSTVRSFLNPFLKVYILCLQVSLNCMDGS
jgi:hypothetical protein